MLMVTVTVMVIITIIIMMFVAPAEEELGAVEVRLSQVCGAHGQEAHVVAGQDFALGDGPQCAVVPHLEPHSTYTQHVDSGPEGMDLEPEGVDSGHCRTERSY
jgi:hypothetical protein